MVRSDLSAPAEAQVLPPDEVRAYRQRAMNNGYHLVRVRTCDKRPYAQGWQNGDPDLLDVRPDSLNTGMLLGELRCIDCDVDDPELMAKIAEQARLHLP